ncbi:MAG: endonuclease III [Treponemataceae bacterium]|nr:endonuclease III [Treponemataceae bacterium]
MTFLKDWQIQEIFKRFKEANPAPKTELIAPNPFTLLVSVVLSAQATDKSVNKATKELYKIADSPHKMAALSAAELENHIKSIGLYKSKAAHVLALSKIIEQKYGKDAGTCSFDAIKTGTFPRTREEFMELPGVGRKTANVMLNVLYHEAVMPVDTHLLRLAPRMGFSAADTPVEVENDLLKLIPKEYLSDAHHWLILHGRYVCTAKKPDCTNCIVADLCAKNGLLEYKKN